jgi:hemoglobin/transferrin/lactoferrin receptor protein
LTLSLTLLLSSPLQAEEALHTARHLDRIVVVAQRQPEPLAQVASSVTLIDREQIDTRLAVDAADVLRYLPGLRMDNEANRFGPQGINIRGLGGNRVRVEIDGVPLPEAFAVGQFASAGRDLGDLAPVERIEVLRGPASTLYGSDALAGIVAVRTLDPADLLAPGQTLQRLRARHDSRDAGRLLSLLHAQSGTSGHSLLLQAFQREGGTLDNRGQGAAEQPNPLDSRRRGLLARFALPLADARALRLLAEHQDGQREADVVSQRFAPGRFASTYRLLGDDRERRDRLSAELELGSMAGLDSVDLLGYLQDSQVDQRTAQFRLPDRATRFESLRERRFVFEQSDRGIDLLGRRSFEAGGVRHDLLSGIEWQRTRYRGLRDGLETNLESGAVSNVILGEALPVRDFPTSVAERAALFVQDEMRFGRLAMIPGLRYERYRLDARPDALFVEDFPDLPVVDSREHSLTGKFGLRWSASARQQLFLQYARGFRAPPFSDLNIGLSLNLLNYEVRPNPELRPETSHGLELGWRFAGEAVQASVAAFQNRFRDLIESRANLGIDPQTGALVFQSVNRDRARIEGVEAEFEWTLGAAHPALDSFRLHAALSATRGQDTRRDAPLNSIDPHRIVLGLRHAAPSGRWGSEWLLSATRRKQRLDETTGELFAPPGHALFDVFAWYAPGERLRLTLGLRNLGDRKLWHWSSVRGLAADTPNLGFYSAPGRSVSLGVELNW